MLIKKKHALKLKHLAAEKSDLVSNFKTNLGSGFGLGLV
jgi:hypothetical protein